MMVRRRYALSCSSCRMPLGGDRRDGRWPAPLGAGVLFGVVVFPFDVHGAVVAGAIQLDRIVLPRLLASRAVPAVTKFQPLCLSPIGRCPPSRPCVCAADDLHALDMGAVNPVLELADELDDLTRLAIPCASRRG